MKGKRKVRWLGAVGSEQLHMSFSERLGICIGKYTLLVLCTLLCLGSSVQMLCSAYEWKINLVSLVVLLFFLTILVCFLVNGASFLLEKSGRRTKDPVKLERKRKRIRWVVFVLTGLTGSFVFLFLLLKTESGKSIMRGLQGILYAYENSWSEYYQLGLVFPGVEEEAIEKALYFAGSVLCFFFVWLACFTKQRLLVAIVPGVVLVAELLVGMAPSGPALFFPAAIILIVRGAATASPELRIEDESRRGGGYGRGTGIGAWLPTAVCVAALFVLVCGIGGKTAENKVADGKQKITEQKEEVFQKVSEWYESKGFDFAERIKEKLNKTDEPKKEGGMGSPELNFSRLDNSTPEYEYKTVLKVFLQERPSPRLYLVGFYADSYRNGTWCMDVSHFEKEAQKASFDAKTISGELIVLGEERISALLEASALSAKENKLTEGQLHYEESGLQNAYLPYFSRSEEKNLSTEGDSRYVKPKKIKELSFSTRLLSEKELVLLMKEQPQTGSGKKAWEPWYEQYVLERYLEVPNGMENVKRIAEELNRTKYSLVPYSSLAEENMMRLNYALLVAEWMRNNTEYSLELSELPKGSDAIEFFLGTSHMGYCMHYASASVMILRTLGVPARYACGYATDSYATGSLKDGFVFDIQDSNRHAWVEIYLNGFGWVPVEVTKGYSVSMPKYFKTTDPAGSSTPIPTKKPENPTYAIVKPTEQPKPTESPKATLTPTPVPQEYPSVTLPPVPQENPSATPMPEQNGAEGSDGEKTEGQTGKEENTKDLQSSKSGKLPLALLFLGLGCGVFAVRGLRTKLQSEADRKLRQKLKKVGNRLKIRIYNRRLYRKLVGRRGGKLKYLVDAEYEKMLQKKCELLTEEEKNRFMVLVKEAAFSEHDFTEDEVAFCRRVYRKATMSSQSNATGNSE